MTLLNLGRHFAVDPSLWPAVCRRVTDLMTGQASLLDPALTKVAAREAEHIAAQLLAQRAVVCPAPAPNASARVVGDATPASVPPEAVGDTQSVLIDSLELVRPRSIGVEHVACWAM